MGQDAGLRCIFCRFYGRTGQWYQIHSQPSASGSVRIQLLPFRTHSHSIHDSYNAAHGIRRTQSVAEHRRIHLGGIDGSFKSVEQQALGNRRSRRCCNRHGSVHLGYFITDLIFKDKQLNSAYEEPEFFYDTSARHYVAELLFGRRFVIGAEGRKAMGIIPQRGSLAGVQVEVPIIPGVGVCARGTASGMIYNGGICSDLYTASAGAYWNLPFARIIEFQTKVMAGWARMHQASGADLTGGVSLSLITDNNFKIKMFGEFDSISLSNQEPWVNTFLAGFSAGFFW